MSKIKRVTSREILDSRGIPTLEVEIILSDGSSGRASIPSGASTGINEALELRDNDTNRFTGKGVLTAIDNIQQHIAPEITGLSALDQEHIDSLLVELDGTHNKGALGANTILGVSMSLAHAAAKSEGKPLYCYLNRDGDFTLPVPMLNIINGGMHAKNSTDFQEFMVVPIGFTSFSNALRAGVEIYHSLKNLIGSSNNQTTVGDEGGFAPQFTSNQKAIELILSAIKEAGYKPGKQCFIALDVAASELLMEDGRYFLPHEQRVLTSQDLINQYKEWTKQYPLISIEDGLSQNEWDNWQIMTKQIGKSVQLVGDDIYTTNPELIHKGINLNTSNALLVKPNQIGTITETLESICISKNQGWGTIISHRSGETEDSSIADIAVATSAGQIKAGAPARGERTAKYNRLLRIEEELGNEARFAGSSIYEQFLR